MSLVHALAYCVWLAGTAPSTDSVAPATSEVEAPDVLVIGTPADDAAVRRVAAELEAIGFSVEIEITTDPVRLASPEHADTSTQRHAIVRVDVANGEAHLFVRDGTGGTTTRIVERGPDDRPAADVVLAHRTVEVLRASLRQLAEPAAVTPEPVAPAPAPTPAPAPAPPPADAPRHDALFVVLGAAVTGSPGRLSPTGHAAVGLRYQPHPRLGITLRGLAPLHARELTRPEGRASAWLGTIEAWLHVGLARPSRRWQPDLGAGVGAVMLGVRGEAMPPLQSRTDLVAAATLAGGAGLSVRLHPRVRVRGHAFVGVALPRPAVRFAGRDVASWGQPFAGGLLGVEIGVL